MIQNLSAPLLFRWIRCCADLVQWCVYITWHVLESWQKVKGQHRFLSDLSSLLLTCCVPCTLRVGQQMTFEYNLLILLGTFLLPPLTSPPLSRNKWATCCCHLLSNLHIMKGSPGRNAWGENTDLVTTYDPKDKLQRWVFLVSLTTSETNLWNGTRMDQSGTISVLFCQRLFHSFSKHYTSWHFENHCNYHKAALSLGKNWASFPLGDDD